MTALDDKINERFPGLVVRKDLVKAVKGDLKNKDAVSAALRKAEFTSLRGDFKFNVNGYPIQNFYLTKVAKRPDGKFQTEIVEKVFSNYGDRYAKDCTAAK